MRASPDEVRESGTVTVLTVDDQPIFRDIAREVVAATPGFETVGEADCGEQALHLVAELGPALVLLDVRMPGMNGVATARRLAQTYPEAMIVLVTIEDVDALPSGAASCGAAAAVRKQDLSPRLLRALWQSSGRIETACGL